MLDYFTSRDEPRWTRWLPLVFVPLLLLYYVASKGNAETKNHDVWAKDQKVYLNTASRIAHDPVGYFTPRQRTPGYPYFLSLFYSKEKFDVAEGSKPPFDLAWFERGKTINIVLSMAMLAGLFLFCRSRLPVVESAIVATASGLLLFTYKAGMVQPELSYWVLNTILFALLGRMLISPGWRLAIACGLLSVLTYFVKAGTQPLLLLFTVTWGLKVLWDHFSFRWRKQRGLLDEGETMPNPAILLGQGALVLAIFFVLLIPYLAGTTKRFGKPFYSVYSEYMMWLPLRGDGSYMINKDYMWAFYNAGARERPITVEEFNPALREEVRKRIKKESKGKLEGEALEAEVAKHYQPLDELPSASNYFAAHPPADGIDRVRAGFERTHKRMKKYYARAMSMLKFTLRIAMIAIGLRLAIALFRRFLPDRKCPIEREDEAGDRDGPIATTLKRHPYLIFYAAGFFLGYLVLYAWYDALQIDARLMLSLYVPLLLVAMLTIRTLLADLSVHVWRRFYLGKIANLLLVGMLVYLSIRLLGNGELYEINEMRKR